MFQTDVNIKLSTKEYKDLKDFCELNSLPIEQVVIKSYKQGFNIEKYGLLSGKQPEVETKIEYVDREVIKYVEKPIEIIKEVEIIKEIIKEVPTPPTEVFVTEYVDREVIKEIPVEKIVEKIVNVYDNSQVDMLIKKIEELENRPAEVIEIVREVPKEIIKEVFIEKQIESNLQPKLEALQNTLQRLKQDNIEKEKKIQEQVSIIQELSNIRDNVRATYLRGSNLDDKLYK